MGVDIYDNPGIRVYSICGMTLHRTSIDPENTFMDCDRKSGHISHIKITAECISILYERKRIQETISH